MRFDLKKKNVQNEILLFLLFLSTYDSTLPIIFRYFCGSEN